MKDWDAKKLAKYHKFTKQELYDILKEALDSLPKDYWIKPNKVNLIFDNGSYFNSCVKWLKYDDNSKNDIEIEIVTFRILQCFGKFSKVQLPKKEKAKVKIQKYEIPSLN